MFTLLPQESYRRTAWKNGRGVTEDIFMLPDNASHDDFDIRVSRVAIVDQAPFSAFPGIDRAITRLGENPLGLRFADGSEAVLEHLVPYRFNSALMPTSHLPAGQSQVLNVMTRRGRWRSSVMAMRGSAARTLEGSDSGLLLVYAIGGDCKVGGQKIWPGHTLIVRPAAPVELEVASSGSCLVAVIEPDTVLDRKS